MFGRLVDGLLTLRKIENVPTGPNNRPKVAIILRHEAMCLLQNIYITATGNYFGMRRDVNTVRNEMYNLSMTTYGRNGGVWGCRH